MKLERQYKHMMDQIRPERELRMADLEETKKASSKGKYLLVLVPAIAAIILAVFLPRGLFGEKSPKAAITPAAEVQDTDNMEQKSSEIAANGEQISVSADGSFKADEQLTEQGARADDADEALPEQAAQAEEADEAPEQTALRVTGAGGVIVAENKMQAVGNIRLYFDQMDKDLEENTVQAFMEKYPETGEAYRKYYDHLHSTNPWHIAEMVYIWLTPGHPEMEDGDYLLLGLRVRTDIQGPYDSLNDEEHPNEGPDMSGWEFHGWSYQLNYLYHYDEASGSLTPVEFPGQQLYLCKDFTFASEGHDVEWYTTDGRVLRNEEIAPYYDENYDITIPIDSYRETQTESFFTINEDDEVVIEGQFTVMDVKIDWTAPEPGDETDLLGRDAQAEADQAYGALAEAHGKMHGILREEEEFVSWKILEEPKD